MSKKKMYRVIINYETFHRKNVWNDRIKSIKEGKSWSTEKVFFWKFQKWHLMQPVLGMYIKLLCSLQNPRFAFLQSSEFLKWFISKWSWSLSFWMPKSSWTIIPHLAQTTNFFIIILTCCLHFLVKVARNV